MTTEDSADSAWPLEKYLPGLARLAVETLLRDGYQIKPRTSMMHTRAGCFVSIKKLNGELRGCVGTIEPVGESLEEDLIANAVNAATRDPRFPVVTLSELPLLVYSVDVLSEIEPAGIEDLDPELFGVVVQEESGGRRGVLLPAIEGVETAEQQIEIATRKAGIAPARPVKLFRFRVSRFSESAKNRGAGTI